MTCPQCSNEMTESSLLMGGATFLYCRVCKKELAEMQPGLDTKSTSAAPGKLGSFPAACTTIQHSVSGNFLNVTVSCTPHLGRSPTFVPTLGSSFTQTIFIFRVPKYSPECTGNFPPQYWIPYAEPSLNDNFLGVNRTQNIGRLAGIRSDLSSMSIEEAILQASYRVAMEGGQSDHVFLCPDDWTELSISLGPRVVKNNNKKCLPINGPFGSVACFSDDACPKGYAWVLQMDTWVRHTIFGTYCIQPGYNAVIKLK